MNDSVVKKGGIAIAVLLLVALALVGGRAVWETFQTGSIRSSAADAIEDIANYRASGSIPQQHCEGDILSKALESDYFSRYDRVRLKVDEELYVASKAQRDKASCHRSGQFEYIVAKDRLLVFYHASDGELIQVCESHKIGLGAKCLISEDAKQPLYSATMALRDELRSAGGISTKEKAYLKELGQKQKLSLELLGGKG